MKSLLNTSLVLCLFCSAIGAQKNEYWAETSPLDSLLLTENGASRVIAAENVNQTQFLFSCAPEAEVTLQAYCTGCEEQPSIKLWGKQEDAYTRWIYLDSGTSISLGRAFESYPEKSALSQVFDQVKKSFRSFWESAKTGRSARRRTPALRGGADPAADEPKLSFLETDYAHYLGEEDFSLSFRIHVDYRIKSLYIIGHEDQDLLFCGGDPSLVSEVFNLRDKVIATLEAVLKPVGAQLGEKAYQLDYAAMKEAFSHEFNPRQWYQLGVELEDDSYQGGLYLFNFRFLTPAQLERLEQFFDLHD